MDKYANLSNFLYNNYVQALEAIATTSAFLAESPMDPDTPFETDLDNEKSSLEKMSCKKDATPVQVDYVRTLVKYEDVLLAYDMAHAQFSRLDLRANYSSKEIGNIRRCHMHTAAKCDKKQEVVEDFERQMEIDEHWSPDHPERIQAQSHITHHLFFKAVDDVERLVVMRLLELTKLQMNGLTEFDLLSHNDGQIQTKQWANPLYRQASTQYFDGVHAKEEVQRLNVEVGHLMTKIHDDAIYYPCTIATLSAEDSPLDSELSWQWDQLQLLNLWHQQRIHQIQSLCGYSRPLIPGARLGAASGVSLADGGTGIDEDVDNEEPSYDGEHMQQVEGYIDGLEHHAANDL
ncbi:hypothetical protein EV702DRAFT_1204412 [Suillus placidus]|uniref:Uncharacterized protein n=1 Tax=Suillus placidus TaxID=48579 RepID=A0A9P7CVJ5_9AGAM|nr:hypothetical protein EV702DRAFT_1204412 [Suillus placidus]